MIATKIRIQLGILLQKRNTTEINIVCKVCSVTSVACFFTPFSLATADLCPRGCLALNQSSSCGSIITSNFSSMLGRLLSSPNLRDFLILIEQFNGNDKKSLQHLCFPHDKLGDANGIAPAAGDVVQDGQRRNGPPRSSQDHKPSLLVNGPE